MPEISQPDPVATFRALLERARKAGEPDATAHVLATAIGGQPSARYVLLKGVDERGFVFFTNMRSRKAVELAQNPRAALCFFWPRIGVEVRSHGSVTTIASEESDAYFRTRPRWSQLGAWASRQSAPLAGRGWLLLRGALHALRFLGRRVRRPPFWGGYRLEPTSIEVLSAGKREIYTRHEGRWAVEAVPAD